METESSRKRRNMILLMLLGVAIVLAIGLSILAHYNKPPKEFTGLVMEKPILEWKRIGNVYRENHKVKVFSHELGNVYAYLYSSQSGYYDYNLILYREIYPPAEGKKIKVTMIYEENVLTIIKAWAE